MTIFAKALVSQLRRICTAYHPQSNGLTEQFNQTICGCLSKFSDGGKLNWEDDLDLILLGYSSSIQSSTLYSPFELVYGMKGIHTVKTYTYKSLLPKFNTPLPEEISPVDP